MEGATGSRSEAAWRAITAAGFFLFLLLSAGVKGDDSPAYAAQGGCPPMWNVFASPSVGSLRSIDAISADDVWAVGDTSILHWDGAAWAIYSSPIGTLNGVAALSASDVWAVGTGTTHWDGSSWEIVPVPAAGTLYSVHALAPNDVWAVGKTSTSPAQTLILRWDGTQWTRSTSPNPGASSNVLQGIAAVSPSDIWAVGYSHTGMLDGQTLTLHWNGSSWTAQPSPNPGTTGNRLYGVGATSASEIWAVGELCNDMACHGRTLALRRQGNNWVQYTTPNYTNEINRLLGVSVQGSDTAFAVGAYYSFTGAWESLVLQWNGTQWSRPVHPNLGNNQDMLLGVTSTGTNDAWAVGYYNGFNNQTLIERYSPLCLTPSPAPPTNTITPSITRTPTRTATTACFGPGGQPLCGTRTPTSAGTFTPETATPSVTGTSSATRTVSPSNTTVCLGPGGQPLCGTFTPTRTTIPTNTIQPTRTPTSHGHNNCGVNPVGGSASCTPPSTYEYSYTFYVRLALGDHPCPNLYGTGSINLEVAETSGGPWTVYATSVFSGTYQAGMQHTVNATFTDNGIPASFDWYRVQLQGQIGPYAILHSTQAAAICTTPIATGTPVSTVTATACTVTFTDVQPTDTFYPFIRCLACRGIISGYADGTFRPNNNITRGQIAKMVANAAGFSEPISGQSFEDVPPASPFYEFIERLYRRGHMGGYPCGQRQTETCIPPENRPYFRPNENATRGQLSKIVSNAAGYTEPHSGQFYADVTGDNPFYLEIMRLTTRGAMSGYPCGGAGEPCDPQQRPYFRWGNPVTRGQASKIVANTFYPNCQTPRR
jgi:hypothetical protein